MQVVINNVTLRRNFAVYEEHECVPELPFYVCSGCIGRSNDFYVVISRVFIKCSFILLTHG
jgi:hypothetical protein